MLKVPCLGRTKREARGKAPQFEGFPCLGQPQIFFVHLSAFGSKEATFRRYMVKCPTCLQRLAEALVLGGILCSEGGKLFWFGRVEAF